MRKNPESQSPSLFALARLRKLGYRHLRIGNISLYVRVIMRERGESVRVDVASPLHESRAKPARKGAALVEWEGDALFEDALRYCIGSSASVGDITAQSFFFKEKGGRDVLLKR